MDLHEYDNNGEIPNEEGVAELEKKDRRSKSASTVISVAVHVVLLLIAGVIVAMSWSKEEEAEFVTPPPPRPKLEPRKLEMKVRMNQLSKRSARPKMAPRLLANTMNPEVALPKVPNKNVTQRKRSRTPTEFGAVGFGTGIGGGSGTGYGGGEGGMGIDFMGATSNGRRFAFVIDYSQSMKPFQQRVVKHELFKALQDIGTDGMATVLFFSGPVWRPDEDAQAIRTGWEGNQQTGWFPKGNGPEPKWFVPNLQNLGAIERMIYETPTTYGTDWYHPLKLALEAGPAPDVIFFMTDGKCPQSSINKTIEMIENLPKGQVVINTVVFGIPEDQAKPLKDIAEITEGEFKHYSHSDVKDLDAKLPAQPTDFSGKSLDYLTNPGGHVYGVSRGGGGARPQFKMKR